MKLSFPEKPLAWNKNSLRRPSLSFPLQTGIFFSYAMNFRATLSFAEWVQSSIWQLSQILAPGQRMTVLFSFCIYLFIFCPVPSHIGKPYVPPSFISSMPCAINTLHTTALAADVPFPHSSLDYQSHNDEGKTLFSYHVFSCDTSRPFTDSSPVFPGLWPLRRTKKYFLFFRNQLRNLSNGKGPGEAIMIWARFLSLCLYFQICSSAL